jgi:hypothetical protein
MIFAFIGSPNDSDRGDPDQKMSGIEAEKERRCGGGDLRRHRQAQLPRLYVR